MAGLHRTSDGTHLIRSQRVMDKLMTDWPAHPLSGDVSPAAMATEPAWPQLGAALQFCSRG